jgi:glutamate/aspartate transport system permease protein
VDGFDVSVITRNLGFLGEGMLLSLGLAALAIAGGILCGAVLAVLRLSRYKPLALAAAGYVNLFRSIPLVLVIFWFYFLVPLAAGHQVGPFYSALIAFVLFETAYYCEIIRAGIQSIPRGQMEAALANGLSRWQAMRYVVVPQAFRNMVPVVVTQCIILFQDTSLVYVVTLRDFMTSASIIANRDLRLVELYVFAALVYLAICAPASLTVRRLQARLRES